jgi:hypothetical protein
MLDGKSTTFALVVITLATSAKRIGMGILNSNFRRIVNVYKSPRTDICRTHVKSFTSLKKFSYYKYWR